MTERAALAGASTTGNALIRHESTPGAHAYCDAAVVAAVHAERERIAQVAEGLDAHYGADGCNPRASFADFLRGTSAGKPTGEEPV